MIKWIVRPACLLVLLSLSTVAMSEKTAKVAKSKYNSYIIIMDAAPAIAYEGEIQGYEATKPKKGKKLNAKSAKVKKYKKKLKKDHDKVLEVNGLSGAKIHDYSFAINGFSARMTHEEAQAVALNKNVKRVIPDRMYHKTTENSPSFLELDGKKGPWAKGYVGEDIVIGVIDTGIWPEHPSFADDGSYSDLGIVLDETDYPACDFGNVAHRADDVAFACNNKLIGARQVLPTYRAVVGPEADDFDSARDADGHGSHTASTAGGNAGVVSQVLGNDTGVISGIAHRARIIAYKGLGSQGGFGSDLAASIDQAVADGVDVINYSIGSDSFAIGSDDVAFLFAADAGVFVATSNGNSGPAPSTTGSPASVPWLTSVGASTQNRTYQGSAQSSDGWQYFGASLTQGTAELSLIDSADAGSELCIPGDLDAGMVAGKVVLCLRGAIARVDKSLAVDIAGGAGMILYNANDGQSQVTDAHWVPSVHINNTDGLVIKDYIANSGAPMAMINAGEFTPIDAPSMAGFSSRGPNLLSSDLIKPDVTAPGVNILAANTPAAADRGEMFQMISGTSMSSPHVAGLFALIKQAHPDWTPAMAKSAIMTSAHQEVMKEDGVTQADAFDMGAGHVVPGGDPKKKGSMFNPGLVYDVDLNDYVAYSCGADLGIASAGYCAALADAGYSMDASDLNLPSIGIAALAGSQTVTRTVTNVSDKSKKKSTYYVNVDAPAGYDVVVSPTKLKLKGGESATYSVTITNLTAEVDVWEHGSLAWSTKKLKSNKKSGKKSAKSKKSKKSKKSGKSHKNADTIYSPIAVKGTQIVFDDYVAGSGEDGADSVDVTFGFAGVYVAGAHGLVAATETDDAVGQDPDQNFNPGDGFSNAHEIVVSGGAMLKIAIPPEATDPDADLDIFLFNPQGGFAAQSANGGTDESITIVAPADGVWTLFVHGWFAPLEPTPYTMYSWVIPAVANAGNLVVDAAPGSATLGATETIEFSWSGATLGQWHYGAVSHSDDTGILGLTTVEVDNR